MTSFRPPFSRNSSTTELAGVAASTEPSGRMNLKSSPFTVREDGDPLETATCRTANSRTCTGNSANMIVTPARVSVW